MCRLVFFRIGWMHSYRGLAAGNGDSIVGGGDYVRYSGYGHEIMNFLPHAGRMYGYVQPGNGRTVDVDRIGGTQGAVQVDGVVVVWVAKHPEGGSYVVGWYDGATVYRSEQPPPPKAGRRHSGDLLGYFAEAEEGRCVLLPPDRRTMSVPRGKGFFGQANVWYADDSVATPVRERVLQLVRGEAANALDSETLSASNGSEQDVFKRVQVEKAAVEVVSTHFQALGYSVVSREDDNLGWDLDAKLGTRALQLEVKGLSGSALAVELTPNEYKQMRKLKGSYRLCVVLRAITNPELRTFSFSEEAGAWEDEHGSRLTFQEIPGARATAD